MTLTQTAILVKQLIAISIIALVLGIGGFIGYKIWYANYLASLPPIEEKPDSKFGSLPEPNFPKSTVSSSNFTYSLDTTTGGLPKVGKDPGFEKIIKVYFVTQTFAGFLSPDKSQALAQNFGIKIPPDIISETRYAFKENDKNLLINLDNGNFTYINEATLSAKESLDDDTKLVSGFMQTLSTLGILKDDLKNGRSKIIRSNEDIAQIFLWPAQVDKKEIFTPDFNKSLINAEVSKGAYDINNYLSLNFTYYPIDTTTYATYFLKTAEAAFEDLKSGKGVVVIEPNKPQVSITSVYLGYYLSENYSPYLMPIYIFEGPNFVAYVNALSSI
ncbi:hypothetical protein KKE03_04725 [Patescibacteria group bacterium]|nr:hypothetical protein [Patescibacteria group bacterium]